MAQVQPNQEHGKTSSCTQPAFVKKYSCMYTTDILKHRKVWHDGFLRIRHINAKVFLLSEEGHTLAESFLKVSLLNRPGHSRTPTTTSNNSDELLNYMKVPPAFELHEDQEIEFDPVDDSESRPASYMARIVSLVKIETESVPLMTPLNSKARQELHKRKMEVLDQTIEQLSKRPKTKAPVQSSPIAPSTPIGGASRRKLGGGFETRPFNSPLIRKSRPAQPVISQPILDPFSTPQTSAHSKPHPRPAHQPPLRPAQTLQSSARLPASTPLTSSPPRAPPGPSTPPSRINKASPPDFASIHPGPPHDDPQETQDPNRSCLPAPPKPASAAHHHPNPRISDKKTLRIDWRSYFHPSKSAS